MTGKANEAGQAADLWRRARPAWAEAAGPKEPPDETILAAYLDGALDAEGMAQVEAWLAASPEALDLMLAARAAREGVPPAVPERVLTRARGLVRDRPAEAPAAKGVWSRLVGALVPWPRSTAWAGVAAALLLASVSGFELGRTGVQHLASLDAALADDLRLVTGRSSEELL